MDEGLSRPALTEPRQFAQSTTPAESRCAMPEQVLWRQPASKPGMRLRLARLGMAVLWLLTTTAFAWTLYQVLSVEPPTVLQWLFLCLSTFCFAWVAIGSASAILGLVTLAVAPTPDTLELPTQGATATGKTALLYPVYREDARLVAATLDAMCEETHAAMAGDVFEVFILSDTQDDIERQVERFVYGDLRSRHAHKIQIYVRWRTPNTGKKAGNIRDWVERFGGAYPYFVILDADSVMSVDALLRLAAAMDAHPQAGLIQTVPRLTGGKSLFAQLQQFASVYYGEIVAAGLAAWHGPGGNYWGHNAIVRTQAFASAAGLPVLPGPPPLGGHILSHDFVEAALLRRAGWDVHMAPSLQGSYEGCPPSLHDLMVRDRRWAQGNLQHLRLLGMDGLPSLSRLHLAMGAFSYLASPVWASTLLVGVVLAVQATYATPAYFGNEVSLFPRWPVFDAQKALTLFLATVFVVQLPKVLGAVWTLRNSEQRRRNGGMIRLIGGVLLESVLSTLIAPLLMVSQTYAVASVLLMQRDAGWGVQRRVETSATLGTFIVQHRWHLGWGLTAAVVCWSISPAVFAWMSPIIVGLVFSGPLAFATSLPCKGLINSLLATDDGHRSSHHAPRPG
jgi:membrane glycosyltransferase